MFFLCAVLCTWNSFIVWFIPLSDHLWLFCGGYYYQSWMNIVMKEMKSDSWTVLVGLRRWKQWILVLKSDWKPWEWISYEGNHNTCTTCIYRMHLSCTVLWCRNLKQFSLVFRVPCIIIILNIQGTCVLSEWNLFDKLLSVSFMHIWEYIVNFAQDNLVPQ